MAKHLCAKWLAFNPTPHISVCLWTEHRPQAVLLLDVNEISHVPNYKVRLIHIHLDLSPTVSRMACVEQPLLLLTPVAPKKTFCYYHVRSLYITRRHQKLSDYMCVSQELNQMTLLLTSPQHECVFTFFVSFIQNVQDPNKLYFLNLTKKRKRSMRPKQKKEECVR